MLPACKPADSLTFMPSYKELIEQLGRLATEQVNANTVDLDRLPAIDIARKINDEDKLVAGIVEGALPQIAQAATIFAETIHNNSRVFYVGAGTSGRLGVLDAAECPPTFGTDPNQIVGILSGGYDTLVRSLEGVEDDREAGVQDLKARSLTDGDFVIGLAASSRTPYTLAALEYAAAIGCRTAFIVCNSTQDLSVRATVLIELPVGPEVITGSTRMKSGTAQKMTLNMISTTAMVLLGKTLGNLMIDLQARSEKLAARSRKILMDLLGLDLSRAEELLDSSGGSVKVGIAMHQLNCEKCEAEKRLQEANGILSRLLNDR